MNGRRWLLAGAAAALTACGTTPAGPAHDRVVGATPGPSGTPTAVSLHVGQLLQVTVLSLEEAEVSPAGVLVQVNAGPGVADFKAVHPGRATVTVSRGVACSPGAFCSHLMVQVGQVAVTVS